jgi:small subunit ribosomal protein S20
LANIKSAIKRLRSAERRRLRNRVYSGRARTAIKKAHHLMDEGRLEEAHEAVRIAVSALDKAAEKGIIHKNNAARRKSRLMRRLNRVESAL